jgi:hypothetical protein
MSVVEFGRVPYLPEKALRDHKVFEQADDRFRSAVRVRQALLREQKGWEIGLYPPTAETQREIGSYLSKADPNANFISAEVAHLVRREVAYREDDSLIDQERLYRNMVSSHPATFNLFGPLKLDRKLASSVARRICPDFVRQATAVLFEHSPARRHPAFTADRTAFDVLIKAQTTAGHGFIAIEVKFTESMAETPARLRPRYDELSTASGLFKDPDSPELRAAPLQQLWRQHMLAAAMIMNGLYSAGRFMVVAPALNRRVWDAVAQFRNHLIDDGAVVTFDAITLEILVAAIRKAGAKDIASLLHERYCDFSPLDALI